MLNWADNGQGFLIAAIITIPKIKQIHANKRHNDVYTSSHQQK